MRLRLRLLARSWRFRVVGIAFAGAVIALVLSLVLTDTFTPRGVVFGSFQICEMCPSQGQGLRPGVRVPIKFVRVGWNREYVAVTDSMGNYSVSLPVGQYRIGPYFIKGPSEVTVIADQRVEADFCQC